ncbi:MAG: hypothetical protein CMM58_09690 [Rhodospirillaceae bacterium]|nr:hypothetical protein [Rhodospirillaceae bacterium]|tara:strand:+ start:725 stop:1141 length:417 start_codon:yes stop_codon:yes gene_type:complete
MKVDQVRRNRVSDVKRNKGVTKEMDGTFGNILAGEIATESVVPSVKVSALDAIVALQETTTDSDQNSRAETRAAEMLDRLDDIRTGLLMGEIPKANLQDLAYTVRQTREKSIDSELNGLLDDIELRARVELAKLDAEQ